MTYRVDAGFGMGAFFAPVGARGVPGFVAAFRVRIPHTESKALAPAVPAFGLSQAI